MIALKSVKNAVEREGMRAAHALDGAAMCELLAFLEDQIITDAMWTESLVADRVDFFRRPEASSSFIFMSYQVSLLFNIVSEPTGWGCGAAHVPDDVLPHARGLRPARRAAALRAADQQRPLHRQGVHRRHRLGRPVRE